MAIKTLISEECLQKRTAELAKEISADGHVDVQSVALLDVVVDQGGHQVVGDADGVEVTGEVEIDVLHGDDLRPAAAGSAALNAENGTEGRLPQGDGGLFADLAKTVSQTDGGGGLALTGGRGGDRGDKNQLTVRIRAVV